MHINETFSKDHSNDSCTHKYKYLYKQMKMSDNTARVVKQMNCR